MISLGFLIIYLLLYYTKLLIPTFPINDLSGFSAEDPVLTHAQPVISVLHCQSTILQFSTAPLCPRHDPQACSYTTFHLTILLSITFSSGQFQLFI